MSRTKKGIKGPGHEYWGKRPGPIDPGKYSKKVTHKLERIDNKKEVESYLEMCPTCGEYEELDGIHYCVKCDSNTCMCMCGE